jgi:hypothetical protein
MPCKEACPCIEVVGLCMPPADSGAYEVKRALSITMKRIQTGKKFDSSGMWRVRYDEGTVVTVGFHIVFE